MLTACKTCHRQFDVSGIEVGGKIRCTCGELLTVTEPKTHEARMQHCSSCGGKLQSGASQCGYCGGTVVLADRELGSACPECFARLGADARFCAECGVKICPQSISAIPVDARCPRCEGEMALCEGQDGAYTECTSCGGLWLDEAFFEQVVEKKDGSAVRKPASTNAPTNAAAARPSSDTHAGRRDFRYLKCPVCSGRMHRKNFAKVSGVIVDWCKGHGFWFDTDELEQIVRFVHSGGLDRSREFEISRQQDRIRQVQRQRRQGSPWTSTPTPAAQPNEAEIFSQVGGSFRDQTGFSIWEAVQEVVGDAFSKVFSR